MVQGVHPQMVCLPRPQTNVVPRFLPDDVTVIYRYFCVVLLCFMLLSHSLHFVSHNSAWLQLPRPLHKWLASQVGDNKNQSVMLSSLVAIPAAAEQWRQNRQTPVLPWLAVGLMVHGRLCNNRLGCCGDGDTGV